MGEVSGGTTVYSYNAEGGISLMNNTDTGTVSGGSGGDSGGDYGIPARIRWTITYDGTNYTGGISGVSFYSEPITIRNIVTGEEETIFGPFYNKTAAQLYQEASSLGNLDSVFKEWNSTYSEHVTSFVRYLEEVAPQCVSSGSVIG